MEEGERVPLGLQGGRERGNTIKRTNATVYSSRTKAKSSNSNILSSSSNNNNILGNNNNNILSSSNGYLYLQIGRRRYGEEKNYLAALVTAMVIPAFAILYPASCLFLLHAGSAEARARTAEADSRGGHRREEGSRRERTKEEARLREEDTAEEEEEAEAEVEDKRRSRRSSNIFSVNETATTVCGMYCGFCER